MTYSVYLECHIVILTVQAVHINMYCKIQWNNDKNTVTPRHKMYVQENELCLNSDNSCVIAHTT